MLMKGLSPGVKHGHPKDTFKPVVTSVAFLGLHGMCLSIREVTVLRSGLDDGAGGRRYRKGPCPMSHVPDIKEEKGGLRMCLYTGGWHLEL